MELTFDTPSRIMFGAGTRFRLVEELRQLHLSRVLVVTDQRLRDTESLHIMLDPLRKEKIRTTIFSDVQPDPTDRNVILGLEYLRGSDAQAIVAIGGGSVIDAGKIIGVAATNQVPLSSFQGYGRIAGRGLPLIAVPTTAGTGSEVTKAAVITDTERLVKMMIFDAKIMPVTSIVDFELSLTMPPQLTAHVGVDTLVHGIEAFVSRKANGMTDPLALSCIRLTARYLQIAQSEPDNREAREAMALAACQGGMAFTNSSVCLVHGMSRPIGAMFHVPHGLSNATLLPAVTRFSLRGAVQRYAEVSRQMGFCQSAVGDTYACDALLEGLERLNSQLGISRLRGCLQTTQDDFDLHLKKMADDALASGSPQNNPVVPTAEQIIELYREAW
jgi:alcohol dehydrogenase class IV